MQVVSLIDDMDGRSKAENTVRFGIDGDSYEIDLSPRHEKQLREIFGPYVAVARKAGLPARVPSRRGRSRAGRLVAVNGSGPVSNAAVREWAKARGLKVSERGRLPAEIVDQYHAAQPALSRVLLGSRVLTANPP